MLLHLLVSFLLVVPHIKSIVGDHGHRVVLVLEDSPGPGLHQGLLGLLLDHQLAPALRLVQPHH